MKEQDRENRVPTNEKEMKEQDRENRVPAIKMVMSSTLAPTTTEISNIQKVISPIFPLLLLPIGSKEQALGNVLQQRFGFPINELTSYAVNYPPVGMELDSGLYEKSREVRLCIDLKFVGISP
ncbi:hypothetical protein AMTR_s00003p00271630 [Amborella trichopoda]|uniref:Uncharacterized protein n=1 Tax=Amborella trichopoda TaxID=13333 RepID=W1P7H2_AMBTC|nr:hypothetical protein AMTR_s00003p00271630 [Amborella trichopoda]